uniref:DDE Tnp4 domain-containing protein n=1 Tax=Brassica oleracea var. oleracea TaxID=109376 RepID=A0A0D3CGX1_BRAOL
FGSQGPNESVLEPVVECGVDTGGDSGVKERRKWSPKEDKILIVAWLNTSKDPVASNEQKAELPDGIYPKWSTFIQSISHLQGPKAELFARLQEATRKDVERAFRVLQARFAIVKNPALSLDKERIGNIMRACIILHNMIHSVRYI